MSRNKLILSVDIPSEVVITQKISEKYLIMALSHNDPFKGVEQGYFYEMLIAPINSNFVCQVCKIRSQSSFSISHAYCGHEK